MRLARVAVERIEHDGIGAESVQLREIVQDLADRSLTGEAPRRTARRRPASLLPPTQTGIRPPR